MRRFELVALVALAMGCHGRRLPTEQPAHPGVCPGVGGLAAGTHGLAFDVGGQTRTSRLYVPRAALGSPRVPLVIVLHGGGGSGFVMQRYTGMDAVADANGFLVAYPDGTLGPGGGNTWNGGDCCGAAMRQGTDDVAFLRAMIDRLVAETCVDPSRVYVTGISNGAIMAYRMACDAADKVAAIAPVAGALMTPCHPSRPVSVIAFHGTDDRSVPMEGGFNAKSDPRRAFPPFLETLGTWTGLDRCTGAGDVTDQHGEARCLSFGPCAEGSEVAACEIAGGGHTWPGGPAVLQRTLGHTTKDISASERMWRFFADHPAPSGR